MALKFPALDEGRKQQVFGITLGEFEVEGERRAVIVTTERDRIVIFWTKADGTWGALDRPHDPLDLSAHTPQTAANGGWTTTVGLAINADGRLALIYGRQIEGSAVGNYWIDRFDFDPDGDRFIFRWQAPLPTAVLGLSSLGLGIWADAYEGDLLIVLQARPGTFNPPNLLLLKTAFPQDIEAVSIPNNWSTTQLDQGGWDFSVRREGPTLAVLHHQDEYAYQILLPPITRRGEATAASSLLVIREEENPTVSYSPLSLVHYDLVTDSMQVDRTIPAGSNPELHRVQPPLITVDRLRTADGGLSIDGDRNEFSFTEVQTTRYLVMPIRNGWGMGKLLTDPVDWPHYLSRFAGCHLATELLLASQNLTVQVDVQVAPLWTARPVAFLREVEDDKGRLLTFAHQDPKLGAVRATSFRVFEDSNDELLVSAESFTIIDINHRPIRSESPERPEHVQFRPYEIDVTQAVQGSRVPFSVKRRQRAGTTLGGTVVAHGSKPWEFLAYTEMGDGGLRVLFGRDELRTEVPIDEKEFNLGWVNEELRESGTAWVTLKPEGDLDAKLTRRFNSVLNPFGPALFCQAQIGIDALALAVSFAQNATPITGSPLTFGIGEESKVIHWTEPAVDGSSVRSIVLDPDGARIVQLTILDRRPPDPPIRSGSDQPFGIRIERLNSSSFATDPPFVFRGAVDENASGFELIWRVDGAAPITAQLLETTLSSTLPDYSVPEASGILDPHRVRLNVRRLEDNAEAMVETLVEVPASLWAFSWLAYAPFRLPPTGDELETIPGFFCRCVTLGAYVYTLGYRVDSSGKGRLVLFENVKSDSEKARFRFKGNGGQQGDIEYSVDLSIRLDDIKITGFFAGVFKSLISVDRVDATLTWTQRFSPGVQTSDKRSQPATETIAGPNPISAEPNVVSGLCCTPIGKPTLTLPKNDPRVTVSFSVTQAVLLGLVLGLIVLIGAAAVMAILGLFAPAVVVAAAGGMPTVLIVAIIAAGATATAAAAGGLNKFIANNVFRPFLREILLSQDVVDALRQTGLFDYAGEMLAEVLTEEIIKKAQEDGHPVGNSTPDGRNRLRSPLIDAIVVDRGRCMAKIRF